MNIYTFKFSKKVAVAIILALALLVALLIILIPGKSTQTAAVKGMRAEQDLVDYITSLGYTVSPQANDSRAVVIPADWDEIYTKYNELQKECGFDLSKYKGKTVTLYTFGIDNYDGAAGVLCDLLVYKDKVIGGSIYTADISGFMHGLKKQG